MSSMRDALKLAIGHIEHMAAWISARNSNIAYEGASTYSFEALQEDMPGIKAAVELPLAYISDLTGRFISEDLQRNLLDDTAFVGDKFGGPLGSLTSETYRMIEAARALGDDHAATILAYMHERICRARHEISGDPFRDLPAKPAFRDDRLCAAAPDLLIALKQILAAAEHGDEMSAVAMAEAAVDKAEGRNTTKESADARR